MLKFKIATLVLLLLCGYLVYENQVLRTDLDVVTDDEANQRRSSALEARMQQKETEYQKAIYNLQVQLRDCRKGNTPQH